jgi:integrase/recombinase XerD
MTGVRFLFRVTLRRHDLAAEVWHLKEPQKLPPVLSPEEVKRILSMATSLKAQVMLTISYGCGLRAAEVVRLWACDIDSTQMIIRVVQSKGRKDRYVCYRPRSSTCCGNGGRRGRDRMTSALSRNSAGCFPAAIVISR